MKNNLSISEVKQLPIGSEFKVSGIISRYVRRRDRNDNPFWDITLRDQSGELDGKVWPLSIWWNTEGGEKFPIDPDNCGIRFEGTSVSIYGVVGEFKDQIQYNIETVYYLDQKEFPPYSFTRQSRFQFEFLESSFKNLVASIGYQPLREFIDAVFFRHNLWEKFSLWPAAVSIHHAYTHGLLEHSVSVADISLSIAKHYVEFGIPVNTDLVVAGALFHDIGKTEVYTLYPSPAMNVSGNIIEHIASGYHIFMKYAELESLEEDIALAISHIILSHHGKREYGSPVLPASPEAMIVSAADDIDFKLNYWKVQIDSISPSSELTDHLSFIDRRLWKGIKPR